MNSPTDNPNPNHSPGRSSDFWTIETSNYRAVTK